MQGKQRIKVLIADDDPDILETYRRELQDRSDSHARKELADLAGELFDNALSGDSVEAPNSFEVTICNQGLAAVEQVTAALNEEQPFDLVILDIRMPPGINGVEAGSRIRAMDTSVPILIITGYSDVGEAAIKKRVPPPRLMHYMTKPIAAYQLPAMIAQAIAEAA